MAVFLGSVYFKIGQSYGFEGVSSRTNYENQTIRRKIVVIPERRAFAVNGAWSARAGTSTGIDCLKFWPGADFAGVDFVLAVGVSQIARGREARDETYTVCGLKGHRQRRRCKKVSSLALSLSAQTNSGYKIQPSLWYAPVLPPH